MSFLFDTKFFPISCLVAGKKKRIFLFGFIYLFIYCFKIIVIVVV